MNDVTHLLEAVCHGDPRAGEQLLPLVYEELRHLAAARMAQEKPGHTLQPTALVHEAWLRLVENQKQDWQGRTHFIAAAAEAMRRILIDRARRKRAVRHGGDCQRVEFEEVDFACAIPDDQLLALDEALSGLEAKHPRQAQVIKLRFIVGLTLEEAAEVLGISAAAAWDLTAHARAWLHRELAKSRK